MHAFAGAIAEIPVGRYEGASGRSKKAKTLKVAALVVAAGRGHRAGGTIGSPKQYALVGGVPVLRRSIDTFDAHPRIDLLAVVIHPDDQELYLGATRNCSMKLRAPIVGGDTRQQSVLAGLETLAGEHPDVVLIHDAARPFADAKIIDRVISALEAGARGAIAASALADTLKHVDDRGRIGATIPREELWCAQTPQGFTFAEILDVHRKAAASGENRFTDDASIAEWAGLDVVVVEGSSANRKLTTAEDLILADRLLSSRDRDLVPHVGTGFDVHRFGDGDHVWLCGVRIEHSHSLVGHSDADVGLHALTDALLGALGDGDIGAHFPPSDIQWKGARSNIFLEDAARRARERGGRISNVDVTLLAETPKIGPHRDAMRAAIAAILEIDIRNVGVKATTMEGLGFVGRGEGLAAMASATVLLPY
ncbi:bifunctional 2-C-methyl-D-erythritol 4-phosphate cytidylyltransferase/2-C-methyl-D-erythritol 2,4-cyclodiphosphate synthase [Filomicrobium sp.]|uniref:bifunctional 2-C-methyl-D-erythritol 4-phosphate cytidylyltransferase/2-C-methyl-D-erythritol 2,4-cyclodiphosphate synthase n=1 Tax=Filomicrobium sp. TaxID=2024831 RepID=UPI00258FC94E|nr:bifunctional 2-C-methyl-D-erythritol 4-phosphate cytidylyltransferase/2-C-methyl-D-erythritol 2,4-cyclodiphosphate synthase [Filomicrobium sp.]MCV0371555.1 bifunctional 2-C-methyl-D-erythritol 4-phosphate cytidylyltransferase/2-C-methyl-D-erythritol 2,4-cyclodiphosphate synthase [Filomicrobium sp.]